MEEWKQIVIDDVVYNYEVSTKGNVRNMKTGHILSPYDNGKGYLKVNLSLHSKYKKEYIHRLVATMFIPNPDNLTDVDHIDKDRSNNCVENLRWVSHKNNLKHSHEKRVKATHKKTGEVLIFDSIRQASTELDLFHSGISACLRGTKKSCGGYLWEYVD